MVTLLLTFLVMLVSVTSRDPQTAFMFPEGALEESETVTLQAGDGTLLYSNRGLMAPVLDLLADIDRLPEEAMFDQAEIKNAIFQLEAAHALDYQRLRDEVEDGISVFRDNRGLVVRWESKILFPEGNTLLQEANMELLRKMALFLSSVRLPVSVESHTNPFSELEGGLGPAAYALSMRRSQLVMAYLVSLGLEEKRFRLAAYGGSRPVTGEAAPDLPAGRGQENSRLEIVVYKPEPGSWLGR
jgi:flagellar motor protein MotB